MRRENAYVMRYYACASNGSTPDEMRNLNRLQESEKRCDAIKIHYKCEQPHLGHIHEHIHCNPEPKPKLTQKRPTEKETLTIDVNFQF